MSLEFGSKGPEGIRHEGTSETDGWSSLSQYPISNTRIGKEMEQDAKERNELLESIDLSINGENTEQKKSKETNNTTNFNETKRNPEEEERIRALRDELIKTFRR